MKYYLDCEFNGFKGDLLSMALIREDGHTFYATRPILTRCDPWVVENVIPILYDMPCGPETPGVIAFRVPHFGPYLQKFFSGDDAPHVICDWPDDIKYLCQELITGPGEMVEVPAISFEVVRVDAYPSALPAAVQHNAWWDAQALKYYLENPNDRL